MENIIDQRYRLDLIHNHLEEVEERQDKTVFFCPLCQSNRRPGKYTQKKGAMFWSEEWNTWRLNCMKCLRQATTMYRYLLLVNPKMAQKYQRDRFHAGRTGKGFDCPNPSILRI
jgi:thymidine kinase